MKTYKLAWIVLLVLGLIAVLSAAPIRQEAAQEEAKEVVASGIGSIVGGDIAHARDDAIEDALRRGLEQAMGLLIRSETIVENFQLIEDNIFSKTQGYVQKYDVVREGKRDEQLYEVTLKAVVKMANLRDDLEAIRMIIDRKNTPRMMLMIDERNIGQAPGFHYFEADMNTAETSLIEHFMAKGFKFVDRATVMSNLDRQQAAAILEGDVSQAAALGRNVGAEVVLTGKAISKATETTAFDTKVRSQQATVTVRAIRADTGDIIATGSAQGAFPHIDDAVGGAKAIEKACTKLSEELMTEILDRWQADVSSGTTITLKVRGVDSYDTLNKFKGSLKYYVRGLSSVVQRDWYEGFATLEVVMTGSSEDLAGRLSGKDMDGIKIKVIGMTQNSVTVELSGGE